MLQNTSGRLLLNFKCWLLWKKVVIIEFLLAGALYDRSKRVYGYSNEHIVGLTIWHHLFLEFWSVSTWCFAHWRHQRAVTRLKNVRHINLIRGKKVRKFDSCLKLMMQIFKIFFIKHVLLKGFYQKLLQSSAVFQQRNKPWNVLRLNFLHGIFYYSQGGISKKKIQLNLYNKFSIFIFNNSIYRSNDS